MLIKFTSEVVWLELRYLRVFSRHLKLGLFGDDFRNLIPSKFLRLDGWFRLLRSGASEDRWMVAPGCDE
jgi:hypothetical protein